jgi:serine/threonine-protein kinase RsbW
MGLLRVSLANNIAELRRINAVLGDFLGEEGVPDRVLNRVRLVVEELVVNAIRYAFPDGTAHRINVELRTEPRRVIVTLDDDGRPFDPNDAPPPPLNEPWETRRTGGLGIYLVKKMSSELSYSRDGDRNRTRVTVDFDLKEKK